MRFCIVLFLTFFWSCDKFVQLTDSNYHEEISYNGSKSFHLFFSNNINGETHPCGCRKFPLGGLAQVNGILKSSEKTAPIFYVDSGDTLFEVNTIPSFIKQSSEFKARKIAEALDKLNLKLFTPGDQDFALGESFLEEISKKHKFDFLITNSKPKMKIRHKKHFVLRAQNQTLVFFGVVNSELLPNPQDKSLFTEPEVALKNEISQVKQTLAHEKNVKFVLLSHAGLEYDRILAKKFPDFKWIIGSHSQSYLKYPDVVGKVNIVQVLSRNHYLGKITFPLGANAKTQYELVETRDETKDLIKNNSFISWLDKYKVELEKINLSEQESNSGFVANVKKPTYISCSDCHQKQVEFWQSTPHSLAYLTLVKNNEENNPKCIGCHSLGFQEKDGFMKTTALMVSEKTDFNQDQYINDFIKNQKVSFPIRKLAKKDIKKHSQAWIKLDVENKISHNFSNVQCLHCHAKNADHPFDSDTQPAQYDIKAQCITCHNADQSPSWYDKDSKGLATSLNQQYFEQKLKEVSCPSIEQ